MLVIPDVAKIPMAKIWSGEDVNLPLHIKLFKNDYAPDHATELGDLTEADFDNYAAGELDNPATQVALDAGGRAVTRWDLESWEKDGATGNTIYGYWVEDDIGQLLWVERFASGAFAMQVDNTILQFYPTLTHRSQFENA